MQSMQTARKKVGGTQDAWRAIRVPNQTSRAAPIPAVNFINASRFEMAEGRGPTKRSYVSREQYRTEVGVRRWSDTERFEISPSAR